ncbi:hypothetical protein ACVI1K_006566 [Bradyrhizobium sp. USDA 4508]
MLAISASAAVSPSTDGSFSTVRWALRPASPKNTGKNRLEISPRSRSSVCRVRIGDSPTSTPAMKAPSTVCTPIRCVIIAIPLINSRITVITAAEETRLSLAQRISRNTSRRPIVKLTARKARVPNCACATERMSRLSREARLKMTAMMIQPRVSPSGSPWHLRFPIPARLGRLAACGQRPGSESDPLGQILEQRHRRFVLLRMRSSW